jgi:D-ribulokinase
MSHFIGVDVGTGSARAAVFDRGGRMLGEARRDIALFQDGPDLAEHSSADIWAAVCDCVRRAVAEAGVAPDDVSGLGFDATCSLVVVGEAGRPLPVGPHGDASRDVIVWMDHRALDQAERINRTGHPVLAYVGGRISPEMQTPKLLWLKEHLPQTYKAAWQFFDLADYLGWRATDDLARSSCTVTCKWTYLHHEERWDRSYFELVGLGGLADEGFARIGTIVKPPGAPLGTGLTARAAADLGLRPGTPVGVGLIDAHAGGLGSVEMHAPHGTGSTRMAYVFGTSACTMASSREPIFIPGVWGPYHGAMVPGLWLSEGGQSGAGVAIERLIALHPAAADCAESARAAGLSAPVWLADQALRKAGSASEAVHLAGELVVVPDFLGNRSPHADPERRAVIAGLGMDQSLGSLVALYVAGLLGIAYGLRQIVEASRSEGAEIEALALSGGAARHSLIRQVLADGVGLPVLASDAVDPVLLGSAMLGAAAAGAYPSIEDAMRGMAPDAEAWLPAGGQRAGLHDRRYAAFNLLQRAAKAASDAIRSSAPEAALATVRVGTEGSRHVG